MKIITILGRLLYTGLFIQAGLGHFSADSIGYAASQGVPLAQIAVPFSGILAIVGGLSILLGYRARWGALILISFLVPVTFMMHAFWDFTDPMQHQLHFIMFLKNLSLIGAALLIFAQGSGEGSLDSRPQKN